MKRSLAVLLTLMLLPRVYANNVVDVYDFSILTQLPSASATSYVNDTLYVVGDDSPSLYALNTKHLIVQETDINNGKPGEDGRIPGRLKADLEGASYFVIDDQPTLILVGSGTYLKARENVLLFSIKDQRITWKNVTSLYQRLRKVAELGEEEFINIEGLASNDSSVFMLSRGSMGPNLIYSFDKQDFVQYMTGKREQIENIQVRRISLPKIGEIESTLSGATWHEDSQKLIVTTSIESDDDGAILGSFLSFVTAKELTQDSTIDISARGYRLHHNNQPLISKIESVSLNKTTANKISGILVADNDDGTSQIMRFDMGL